MFVSGKHGCLKQPAEVSRGTLTRCVRWRGQMHTALCYASFAASRLYDMRLGDIHSECICSLYLVLKRLTARCRLVSECGAPEERAMPARLHTLCEGDTRRNLHVSLGCRGLRRITRHRCGACWRGALQALAGPRQIVLEPTEPVAYRHEFWDRLDGGGGHLSHWPRRTGHGSP
jgi:hypothetical protein